MRLREASGLALAAALVLNLSSCILLPVRVAPGIEGTVVDRASGEPLADAIVLVRFDGHYGDALPDREHLGHAETVTGPDGRFRVRTYVRGGVSLWPHFRTEARVVGVMREGYRCPPLLLVPSSEPLRIELSAALDPADRRDSCRPVSSRRGEAEAYHAAWRKLFPTRVSAEEREQQRQLERLLAARAAFGFGDNCEGPVRDLALAPGGRHAAFAADAAEGPEIRLVELTPGAGGRDRLVAKAEGVPPRRLAWTGPDELVLWQPSSEADRVISPSIFAPGRSEVVWTGSRALPRALDGGAPASSKRTSSHRPLDPEDLSDEAETRWLGRSFSLERRLDPETGLSRDRLRVTRADGSRHEIDLPGEPCGPRARFGQPHYRIAAGGRLGLDLRWVDGGCHAVRIDFETGGWTRLDHGDAPSVCRAQRRVAPGQLATALRGWTRELHTAMDQAGADPGAAYVLRIAPDSATQVQARDFAGEPLTLKAPRFPVSTPLRRIDVTNVAPATPGSRAQPQTSPAALEPL
jgi:hypothetical protein